MGEPPTSDCEHPHTTSTITAGLERVVCESCGHVSIRYQEDTVRIWQEAPTPSTQVSDGPDVAIDLTTRPSVTLKACGDCGSTALYYTPKGLACSYHAWEAASEQEATGQEFWIPILIDRSAY